ncbi:MAG: GAF domain-containing protein [Chloroflexi bacterium]|nr:GAF domain-containing protein [Chloroflexota bacterium]
MSKRILKWLTIILPVSFWLIVLYMSGELFDSTHSTAEIIFTSLLVSIGAIAFSNWVFRSININEAEIERRADQLGSLNAAALELTTELDLEVVLQKAVDLCRELVQARYGALGILSENDEYFDRFVSSGITDEQKEKIGDPPSTKGFFSQLLKVGTTLRVKDIQSHHLASGFPSNHPKMNSLIGVPIVSNRNVIGDLYLADKISQNPKGEDGIIGFDDQDQRVLEMFAVQVAIAIDNARLYRQVQDLVLLKERERIGMDLHDGIIQSIYAIGLMLDDIQRKIVVEPVLSGDRISQAIHGLNDVISDLRNYILDLRPQRFQGRDLLQGLEELARALRANTFITVSLDTNGVGNDLGEPEQVVEILHIAQEALANVRKHSRANDVSIRLELNNGNVVLIIEDNGISISASEIKNPTGNGLHNMHERAVALNGNISIFPREGGGTIVSLKVPVKQ